MVAGVVRIDFAESETVSVTYDEVKTSPAVIADALRRGGFSVKETDGHII